MESIIWRRLDHPGHDMASVERSPAGWSVDGMAVFAYHGVASRLVYRIRCDREWRTVSGEIEGRVGANAVRIEISADPTGIWRRDGGEVDAVRGCLDVDLAFTPATNMLPIRRLDLAVGQEAPVRAAWLRFPELTLEPLEQTYRRLSELVYRYESGGGTFVRELEVNATGFVTRYPGLWEAEDRSAV